MQSEEAPSGIVKLYNHAVSIIGAMNLQQLVFLYYAGKIPDDNV